MADKPKHVATDILNYHWHDEMILELRERLEREVREGGEEPKETDADLFLQWLRS